jgi:hypothetical protein
MAAEKQRMKNKPETKGGAGPAANASFDPERGYGTSEQKERIREAGE